MVDQAWHQDGIPFIRVFQLCLYSQNMDIMVLIIKKNTHLYRERKIGSAINTSD